MSLFKRNTTYLQNGLFSSRSQHLCCKRLQCLYWSPFPLVFSAPLPLTLAQLDETVWNPKSLSFSSVNERPSWNASLTKTLQRWKQPREQLRFTLKPYTHKAIYFTLQWRTGTGGLKRPLPRDSSRRVTATGIIRHQPNMLTAFMFSCFFSMHHSVSVTAFKIVVRQFNR